jgi:hypothetical protein
MKQILLVLFIILSHCGYCQKKLPVIKAGSSGAKIYEGDNSVIGWNLSPETKPDVFTTNKIIKSTIVKFITDSDSISFTIKPGRKKDFIVLLNGKDSCYTRIQGPEIKDFSKLQHEIHDSIALTINEQNTIYVKAVLNKTDTLNLNFDSGTSQLVITRQALTTKVKSDLTLYTTSYELALGARIYKPLVYDTELSGHDTDGRFGWDLFDGMIVELNYDKMLMIVHSKMPKSVKRDKAYTKLNMKYFNQLFLVESEISQNGIKNNDWFLFDTGYQKSVMLDNDLLRVHNFPLEKMEVINKVIMHGAQGNEIPVVTSKLQNMQLGKYELKDIPAQILTTNKPMSGATIHILGNEVLKRFNMILDFQNNVIYLKPNVFFKAEYVTKKGNGI